MASAAPPEAEQPDAPAEEGLAVCELCFTQASPEEVAAAEMAVPYAEEQRLIEELLKAQPGSGETIIAYCLTLPPSDSAQPS